MTRHDRLFLQPLQPVDGQHELDPLRDPPEERLKDILNIAISSLVNALLKQVGIRQAWLGLSSAAECSLGKKILTGQKLQNDNTYLTARVTHILGLRNSNFANLMTNYLQIRQRKQTGSIANISNSFALCNSGS